MSVPVLSSLLVLSRHWRHHWRRRPCLRDNRSSFSHVPSLSIALWCRLGGSLAALGAKSVVVVSAIIGSYMVAVGLDFFALKVAPGANETLGFCVNSTGRISEMLGADTRLEPPAPPSTAAGVWLVAVVAVALAGMIVQALWCKPVKRTPAWGGRARASVNTEVRYRPLVPTSNYSYSDM